MGYTMTGKLNGTMEATTPNGNLSSRQFTPLDTAINRPVYAGDEGNPIAHYPLTMYQSVAYFKCFHALCNTSFCLYNILPMFFNNQFCQLIQILRHQLM